MDQSPRIEPGFFIRSFMIVAGLYVFLFVMLLLAMLGIARLGYPEIFELWTTDQANRAKFEQAWEQTPEVFWPTGLCFWLIAAGASLGLFVGLQAAYWAPIAKAGHGVFLAIICIVSFLQISITQESIPKWFSVALLIVVPTCIVLSAKVGDGWFSQAADEEIFPDESTGER